MPRQVSRRRFLLAAGVAGATVPVAAAAPGLAQSVREEEARSPGIVGAVTATGRHSLTIDAEGDAHKVVAAAGASISRGPVGPLVDLSSFAVGDRIAVEGVKADGIWTATAIGTAFDGVAAYVEAIDYAAGRMRADGANVDISRVEGGPGRVGRSEIRAGSHVSGLKWRDPAGTVEEAVLLVAD